MTESFAQLFEESLKQLETRPGAIVKGTVVAIENGIVLVDAGLKSESAIPAEQFKNALGELEIALGDVVDVALDSVEDGFGETQLSREKGQASRSLAATGKGLRRTGHRYGSDQRQGQGWFHCRSEQHPCIPAGFSG